MTRPVCPECKEECAKVARSWANDQDCPDDVRRAAGDISAHIAKLPTRSVKDDERATLLAILDDTLADTPLEIAGAILAAGFHYVAPGEVVVPRQWLDDVEAYLDQRADAQYFTDSSGPHPNAPMRLLTELRALLAAAAVRNLT